VLICGSRTARKSWCAAMAAWNAKGTLLAFGTEDGDAGILEF
jgi:hypothetical protein